MVETMTHLATNPFLGLMLGIFATVLFQSSSTTTSLVVGLVAADFLNLGPERTIQAVVPMMIGANIGTSVTNTLVSVGHINNRIEFSRAFSAATVHDMFNILCVLIFMPLQATTNFLGKLSWKMANAFEHVGGLKVASPLKLLLQPQVKLVNEIFESDFLTRFTLFFTLSFIIFFLVRWLLRIKSKTEKLLLQGVMTSLVLAFALSAIQPYFGILVRKEVAIFTLALGGMFASLFLLVKLMKNLMLGKLEVLFHRYIFKTALRSLIMGGVLTILVQSSSITTSLLVPLAGAGILTIYQVFPFTLGANVGTTVTALLAALSTGQIAAVAVAFSHLLFNLLGLAVFYFNPMRLIPIRLSLAFSNYASRYKMLPFAYIAVVFFVIPFMCIYWL